jgi:hypothetical protein
MEYKSGDRVGNSTLYVESTYYNKVVCRCQKCLISSVYKTDELNDYVSCKVCNKIGLAPYEIDKTKDMEAYGKMTSNEITGAKLKSGAKAFSYIKTCDGLSVREYVGDLVIERFISKIQNTKTGVVQIKPEEAMLTCPHCNCYKRIESIENLLEYKRTKTGFNLKCQYCSDIIEKANNEVKDALNSKVQRSQKIIAKNNDKRAAETKEDGTSQLIIKMKSPLDAVKANSKLDIMLNKVRELNENLKIQDVEPSGASYKVICTCNKCGTEIVIPSTKKSKSVECPGCERLKTDLNYTGAFNKNYVGTTKNLLELVERTGDTCTVVCNSCGRKYNNIKFFDWYKGKVICNCENNQLNNEILCSSCGEFMSIALKDVINKSDTTKQLMCDKCKKESGVTIQEVIDDYIEAPSIAVTTSNKLGLARNKIKASTDLINEELVKSKEPLYIGTDGNMYYKCTCLKHSTDMILNDDEISVFEHAQCSDARQHIMNDIVKSNISL